MRAKLTIIAVALSLLGGAAQARADTWGISAIWINSASGLKCPYPQEPLESICKPYDTITLDGVERYRYESSSAWPVALTVLNGEVWLANVGSSPVTGDASIDQFNPATGTLIRHEVKPWPTTVAVNAEGKIAFTTLWPTAGTIDPATGQITEGPPVASVARAKPHRHRKHKGGRR